jgi:hypothetical protein
MWRKLRCLLQPGDTSATDHSADDFARHFTMKVDNIRSSTAGAPPPVITSRTVSEPLASFEPVTADEVRRSLGRVPAKHCILDPVPTWLLKRVDGIIAPVIARMCNASFEQCSLPVKQKMAVTRPLLKKSSLDPNDLNSYRPISNLSFVSKMVERMVDSRLIVYTDRFDLIPVHQSAYRRYHSTETALVRLYNDMVQVIDRGHVGALVLLDISAAFDTVDHRIMNDVLRQRFDVCEDALAWFNSYFDDRTQVVSVGSARSQASSLSIGVPQGSVLGPRTYVVYAEDVQEIFELRQVSHHLFADDMQGHTSSKPQDALMITSALQECIVAVSSWCASKRLQLNAKKTEVLWFGSVANLRKVAHADRCLTIGPDIIQPLEVVRDLGVYFDMHLTMKAHIARVSRTCFFHLRRLRSIRVCLGREVTIQLVVAFVISRLDYCNALLANLPASTLAPLQRVLHAAARLVMNLGPRDPVTPALRELHWLPIQSRIQFKLCLLVHHAIGGRSPGYISELVIPVADIPGRSTLRSAERHDLFVPRSKLVSSERAFSVAAPKAWNRLPVDIRLTPDTRLFKKQLKTFLFSSAYPASP